MEDKIHMRKQYVKTLLRSVAPQAWATGKANQKRLETFET
jgi:hypothetical protein